MGTLSPSGWADRLLGAGNRALLAPLVQQRRESLLWLGLTEEVALHQLTARRLQQVQLFGGLNAFNHQIPLGCLDQINEGVDDRQINRIPLQIPQNFDQF